MFPFTYLSSCISETIYIYTHTRTLVLYGTEESYISKKKIFHFRYYFLLVNLLEPYILFSPSDCH